MIKICDGEISQVSKVLKAGGLAAFPTETVYGFGVIFDNEVSYKKLIDIKRRPPEKPFTLMCADKEDIDNYAIVDERARKLINAFMPGQFTIILKAKNNLPKWVVAKEGTVGIRVPDFPMVNNLIREAGKPLLVPSANRSGEPPLTNGNDVEQIFKDEIDALIMGESTSNVPSTIVLVDEKVVIIREGLITKEQIFRVLGE